MVTAPLTEREALVKALDSDIVVPTMAPWLVTPALVMTPDCRLDKDAAPPVSAPELENEATFIKPLTLPEFMTNAPITVVVFVASLPMTIVLADGPSRTTPLMLPVPPSRTRSPPLELP